MGWSHQVSGEFMHVPCHAHLCANDRLPAAKRIAANRKPPPTPLKQNEKNRYSADTCPQSRRGTIAVMFNSSPKGAPS
jgi:hypothetical protein